MPKSIINNVTLGDLNKRFRALKIGFFSEKLIVFWGVVVFPGSLQYNE